MKPRGQTEQIVEINGWSGLYGYDIYIAHTHCKAGERIIWTMNSDEPWKTKEPKHCGTCGARIAKIDFLKILCFLKAVR